MPDLEPIFIAENVREADIVEGVLEDEGIEFKQRLAPVMRETSAVCYQGTLFEVNTVDADHSRRLLLAKGLSRGIVPNSDPV